MRAPVPATRTEELKRLSSQPHKARWTLAAKESDPKGFYAARARNSRPQLQPGIDAFQVETGGLSNLALNRRGQLQQWIFGHEPSQPVDKDGVGAFPDWEAIDMNEHNQCGLRAGGQLYCWDSSPANSWQERRLADWSGVRAFSTGLSHCAILRDGTLHCWGIHASGNLGIGPATDLSICSGMPCSLTPRRVGTDSDWQEIDAHGSVCGRRGGKIFCWGAAQGFGGSTKSASKCRTMNLTTPCYRRPVAAFTQFNDWAELAVGTSHVCARRSNGDVYCRGSSSGGQLGLRQPVIKGAAQIGSGSSHSCALVGGKIWCWGNNSHGQLGDGLAKHDQPCALNSRSTHPSQDCSAKPVEVPPPPSGAWARVAPGSNQTCAVASDGAVFCWGDTERGFRCGNE